MGTSEIQDVLTELAHGRDLTTGQAETGFRVIMNGGATPAQIAAFLMGLRQKGETATEIAAGARVIRHKAATFASPPGCIDVCGTGGDGSRTLNISTAVAIVTAACGVPVAKHGNRAITSASGSSDVLEALGVNIRVEKHRAEQALAECGLTFLMAPLYHPALRHVSEVRKELGLRTVFNLLGPLANPAGTTRQLIGVYDRRWLVPLAEVLRELGSKKAWIVHGSDGMDEITLYGPTHIAALEDGAIREFMLDPADYGIERPEPGVLAGLDAQHNASELRSLLLGRINAYRDIVLLNAAAALVVADKAETIPAGITIAAEAIDNGAANRLLAQLARVMG